MKTVYSTGTQKTESVSYRKGQRERFEFGDVVLLKQHDLQRTVHIVRSANTYMLVPDGASSPQPAPATDLPAAPAKPGVVTVATNVVDTGERKTLFNLPARHAKMTVDKQPEPGACDPSKQHIETDGWYVDLPATVPTPQDAGPAQKAPAGACIDDVKATMTGDPKVLGFPISYTTTMTGEDGMPNVVTMETTELELSNLDAALFDIPPGMSEAGNIMALSKAVSDASETKLAQDLSAPTPSVTKTPGVVLVGVPEVVNKTTQQIDTRALRGRLVSALAEMKLGAVPLPGAETDITKVAAAQGYDYVLLAEVTELKTSKAGGLGGMLKAATKIAGGADQEPTEAAVTIKLLQPDGKSRLSTTVRGKNSGGFDMKTGLGVAKFAGTMYMNMMSGKMMMNALNQQMAGNLGGVGMLGNPSMANMGMAGLGGGTDPTASAARFLMQQAMASNAPAGAPGQGPSFDVALGDAFDTAAKAVSESLKKLDPKK
jgi:hypothetical protein